MRADAALAWSHILVNETAGTATGNFGGTRLLASGGIADIVLDRRRLDNVQLQKLLEIPLETYAHQPWRAASTCFFQSS